MTLSLPYPRISMNGHTQRYSRLTVSLSTFVATQVHPSLCGDCTTANCIDGDDEECKKVEGTGLGYPDPVPCSLCKWPTRDIDRVSPTCVVCTEVKHARCDTNASNATDDDDLDYLCATCEGTTHGRCCVCESVSQYEGGKMGGLFDAMFYCCECIAVRERRE